MNRTHIGWLYWLVIAILLVGAFMGCAYCVVFVIGLTAPLVIFSIARRVIAAFPNRRRPVPIS